MGCTAALLKRTWDCGGYQIEHDPAVQPCCEQGKALVGKAWPENRGHLLPLSSHDESMPEGACSVLMMGGRNWGQL